jgi:hypothetical protein
MRSMPETVRSIDWLGHTMPQPTHWVAGAEALWPRVPAAV